MAYHGTKIEDNTLSSGYTLYVLDGTGVKTTQNSQTETDESGESSTDENATGTQTETSLFTNPVEEATYVIEKMLAKIQTYIQENGLPSTLTHTEELDSSYISEEYDGGIMNLSSNGNATLSIHSDHLWLHGAFDATSSTTPKFTCWYKDSIGQSYCNQIDSKYIYRVRDYDDF